MELKGAARDDERELITFCRTFGTMLGAGIDERMALASSASKTSGEPGRILLAVARSPRERGTGQELARRTDAFAHARERFAAVGSVGRVRAIVALREICATWMVAERSGAGAGAAMSRLAVLMQGRVDDRRERDAAAAAPLMTARMLTALPLFGVIIGTMIGVDLLRVLATSPVGWACLVVGVVLLAVGRWWQARLVRSIVGDDGADVMALHLAAVAIEAGCAVREAAARAAAAAAGAGLDPDRWGQGFGELDAMRMMSERTGVPVLRLLDAALESARADRRADIRFRAARLETLLLLPLGCCFLPAFVVLAIIPLVLGLAASTGVLTS